MWRFKIHAVVLCCCLLPSLLIAQESAKAKKRLGFVKNGNLYFSWGYNKEWYTRSTVEVNQPELGNHYQMNSVKAHDRPGWNTGIFNKPLTVPQYNYRLGYFFNEKQDFAIEINFDHTKFIIQDQQDIKVTGTQNHQPVSETIAFNEDNGFYYYLNNGANFLLFNLVKRFELYHLSNQNFKVDFLTKAGIGPVIPHVQNSLYGKENESGFQLGGWNAGVETALKVTAFKHVYLEFAQKVDYARYSNLKVYKGRARQAFGTYELILSLGVQLPTGKNNIEYRKKAQQHFTDNTIDLNKN
jgi:hypothetical protein